MRLSPCGLTLKGCSLRITDSFFYLVILLFCYQFSSPCWKYLHSDGWQTVYQKQALRF
uniref:Uncharacterized protein n=1 Tax=Anguilla anguilla TaxID=7936 RepID=A0A0E9PR50_ANGAN